MMTFGEYAKFLREQSEIVETELSEICAVVAENAAIEARHMVGNKQAGWEDLSAATVEVKRKLGFSAPDYQPLLRSGKMRDSIEWISTSMGGAIGSNDKVMFWQELGTTKMPPRPLLGQAVLRMMPLLEQLLEESSVKILVPVIR